MVNSLVVVWLSTAFAGQVVVEDPTGCIDDVGLRAELTDVLGEALQRIDVYAQVSDDRGERRIALTVDADAHQWTKVMTIESVDCPHAPSAAALTIKRGLAALPGFDWEKLVRGPPLFRLGGSVGLSGPLAPRVVASARSSLGDTFRGIANLRVEASPLWRTNATRIVALTAGLSAGPTWRVGFLEIRPEIGGQLGALWVLLRDPDVPRAPARMLVSGVGGGEIGGAGPWSLGVHTEVAEPLIFVSDTGRVVGVEPAFRVMSTLLYTPKFGRE